MPRNPDHSGSVWTETAGTLTNTTVSISANAKRRGLIIGNPSDTVMTFRVGGTATATAGVPVPAGDAVVLTGEMTPTAAVSVFCAGTSKAYCIYECTVVG